MTHATRCPCYLGRKSCTESYKCRNCRNTLGPMPLLQLRESVKGAVQARVLRYWCFAVRRVLSTWQNEKRRQRQEHQCLGEVLFWETTKHLCEDDKSGSRPRLWQGVTGHSKRQRKDNFVNHSRGRLVGCGCTCWAVADGRTPRFSGFTATPTPTVNWSS